MTLSNLKTNLFFIFSTIFITILLFNLNNLNKQIDHELKENMKNIKVNVHSSLYYFEQATKNINHFITHNDKLLNILSKANQATNNEKNILRKNLYTILQKPYARMKNMGVLQFHFVLSSNESFLRMHYPSKFGDNLSQIRETYKHVKKTKQAVFSFENGKYQQGYRYVYPIFNKDKKYIGAFEMSYPAFQLQKDLYKISQIQNHFLIKKDLLDIRFKNIKNTPHYIQSIENDNYLFSPNFKLGTNSNLNSYKSEIIDKNKKLISNKMDNGEEFSLYSKLENSVKTINFLPIHNLKGIVSAYLVIYDTNEYIYDLIINSYIINSLIFISLLGLFIFIYFLKHQKKILNKLVEKRTNELNDSIKIINEFVLFSTTDTKGKILDVSDAFCKLTEYTRDELINKNHRMLRPKEFKKDPIYAKMWTQLLKGDSWEGEIQDISKSGKRFWLDTKILPIKNSKGEITGYNAYRYNISDKKQLIDLNNNLENLVLEETAKSLKQKEIILKQEKSVALGNMMDAIAHQWKQPLTVIAMIVNNFLTNYILNSKVSQKDIDDLEYEINTQIEHLVTTIDEFRGFFRPNQKFSMINLHKLVEQTVNLMHGTLINNNIKVNILIDPQLEIKCIPNEFKHIIINLVNNSKDAFMENNIKNRILTFETKITDDLLYLEITDTAGGIPQDILKNIFIPNFTTKDENSGTGIGLYMVKQIIEKLSGTITVSNEKSGACFKIKLLEFQSINNEI